MALSLSPASAFLGTALLGLGGFRLLAPRQAYALFGLSLSSSARPSPFLCANAGRDLALGLAYVLLGLQHNREGLRAVMVATAVAAQVDAYIVWAYGGPEYGGWRSKWIGHSFGGAAGAFVAWKGWGC